MAFAMVSSSKRSARSSSDARHGYARNAVAAPTSTPPEPAAADDDSSEGLLTRGRARHRDLDPRDALGLMPVSAAAERCESTAPRHTRARRPSNAQGSEGRGRRHTHRAGPCAAAVLAWGRAPCSRIARPRRSTGSGRARRSGSRSRCRARSQGIQSGESASAARHVSPPRRQLLVEASPASPWPAPPRPRRALDDDAVARAITRAEQLRIFDQPRDRRAARAQSRARAVRHGSAGDETARPTCRADPTKSSNDDSSFSAAVPACRHRW